MTILQTFEDTHPGSRRLAERAASVFPSGVTHDIRAFEPFPIYAASAQGPRKQDVDGHEYVDYIGGHGALLLGHNRPEVAAAIREALEEGTHFGSSQAREIEWGELVLRMAPCAERVRFTSSGTEATMMALRLARAFSGRNRVIKLADHFHGWHDLAVGQLRASETQASAAGVPPGFYDDLTIVPPGDIAALEQALAPRDVAALILEPTGAHWGLHPIGPDYLRAARELTAEAGTLLVMDEVITGFRVAPGGAQERYGVTPDLATYAKILAGGLPGGCVAGREDVISMLEFREGDAVWNRRLRVPHQGTYNAQPPARRRRHRHAAHHRGGRPDGARRRDDGGAGARPQRALRRPRPCPARPGRCPRCGTSTSATTRRGPPLSSGTRTRSRAAWTPRWSAPCGRRCSTTGWT